MELLTESTARKLESTSPFTPQMISDCPDPNLLYPCLQQDKAWPLQGVRTSSKSSSAQHVLGGGGGGTPRAAPNALYLYLADELGVLDAHEDFLTSHEGLPAAHSKHPHITKVRELTEREGRRKIYVHA